jgi:hypothetical protein
MYYNIPAPRMFEYADPSGIRSIRHSDAVAIPSDTFIKEMLMNRRPFLLLLLLTAACQSAATPDPTVTPKPPTAACTATATQTPPPTLTATEPAPAYLPAFCTLIGRDVRTTISTDRPVILWWGWGALTEGQVEDFLDASTTVVTFDGVDVKGEMQDGISYDEESNQYKVMWMEQMGTLEPGIHPITYSVVFRRMIFDGWEYYGPGSSKETQEDYCEVLVE